MSTTAWAHLPNAKHIDRILADLKKNPKKWSIANNAAGFVSPDDARDAAWDDAINAIGEYRRSDAYDAAWHIVWDDKRDTIWGGVTRAILALVAWDDCGYLMDEKPEDVQMLALLGNKAAVLLYPVCVILQKESVKQL